MKVISLRAKTCEVVENQGGVALASTLVAMSPIRFLAPFSSFLLFPTSIIIERTFCTKPVSVKILGYSGSQRDAVAFAASTWFGS